MSGLVDALTAIQWLVDGQEMALLDVREHGQYGEGHPFFAVNLPYSRLELEAPRLLPRLGVRTVLLDDGGGVAAQAGRRLAALGYSQCFVLQGGAPAWAAAGYALFKGVNVPSKTFGELLEVRRHTPRLSAAQLQARLAAGEDLLLLDGRTPEEHCRMCIPGAVSLPNGELVQHIGAALNGDTRKPIVVHCAGRTRSIVGVEILRELGLENPIFALENGTQGWQLAGYDLEHGSQRKVESTGAPLAPDDVSVLRPAQAQAWLDDAQRTTYVFDVRTASEFAAGSLPGACHVPGGQLLQTTDLFVAVRHAQVLVLDDGGPRAPLVARWLRRLGHQAAAVRGGISSGLQLPLLPTARWQALGGCVHPHAGVIDLRPSQTYRAGHAPEALWSIRPRVVAHARTHFAGRPLVLVSDQPEIAALAALDLREAGFDTLAWRRSSPAVDAAQQTPQQPSDSDAIDQLFFVHDRHHGNLDAARRYLEWEQGLIAQCQPDELASFGI